MKRAVTLNLDHENVEYLKGKRINISSYVNRFLTELVFAAEHGSTIRIGRLEEPIEKGR